MKRHALQTYAQLTVFFIKTFYLDGFCGANAHTLVVNLRIEAKTIVGPSWQKITFSVCRSVSVCSVISYAREL